MIKNIVIIFIIIYIIFISIIKIKFNFWSKQPVFHIYDLHYFFFQNKIIQENPPNLNKYVNKNINTIATNNLSDKTKTNITEFINKYYLKEKNMKYIPDYKHIFSYLENNNHSSYFSIFGSVQQLDSSTLEMSPNLYTSEFKSVISSKSLNIKFKNLNTFPIYYVDNLCVNKLDRKKGIAPQAISTLYYDLRHNTNIKTYLFKREGQLTGIIPLTVFDQHLYSVDNLLIQENGNVTANYKIKKITSKNISLFLSFIYDNNSNYDLVVMPDLSNILHQIRSKLLFIYGLYNVDSDNLEACILYRDTATYYNNNLIIEVPVIINNCNNINNFIYLFNTTLKYICNKFKTNYILIEELGDAIQIIKRKNMFMKKENKFSTAYFIYNYISLTQNNNKSIILT